MTSLYVKPKLLKYNITGYVIVVENNVKLNDILPRIDCIASNKNNIYSVYKNNITHGYDSITDILIRQQRSCNPTAVPSQISIEFPIQEPTVSPSDPNSLKL